MNPEPTTCFSQLFPMWNPEWRAQPAEFVDPEIERVRQHFLTQLRQQVREAPAESDSQMWQLTFDGQSLQVKVLQPQDYLLP